MVEFQELNEERLEISIDFISNEWEVFRASNLFIKLQWDYKLQQNVFIY